MAKLTQEDRDRIDFIKLKSVLETGSTEEWEECLNWPSSDVHEDGVFYNFREYWEYHHPDEEYPYKSDLGPYD